MTEKPTGLLELLDAEDVEGFNARRGERSKPELFAADLSGKLLAGVDFSSANLDKSDITECDLAEANLVRASFAGADASGARLRGALALKSRWTGAWLDGADLADGDFSRADLTQAVLKGSKGANVCMAGARLKEADVSGSDWTGADLADAQIGKADFSGAILTGASLGGLSGPGANLSGAKMDGVSGRDVRLPEANLSGASLVGAQLPGANLAGADLQGADLTSADLSRSNLTGAKLAGAILRGATLADATLDGADLTGVDLTGVDLTGVDPSALGLSADQLGGLAGVGVAVDEDAPIRIAAPSAARQPSGVLLIWENVERLEEQPPAEEGLEPPPPRRIGTVRGLFLATGGEPVRLLLPVPLDGVLASGVAPAGDGFVVWILRSRAGGVASVHIPVDGSGRMGAAVTAPLGYEPLGVPVASGVDPLLFGLARRGPTVAVHKRTDAGWAVSRSDGMPTAIRFVSRHHPIVACKGGVVVPVTTAGPGKPLKTPTGFPGQDGCVVPTADGFLAIWIGPAVGRDPASIRVGALLSRGTAETVNLAKARDPRALDAVGGTEPRVAWLDGDQAWISRADEPEPVPAGAPLPGATALVWAPAGSGGPALVIVGAGGAVRVTTADGTALAEA